MVSINSSSGRSTNTSRTDSNTKHSRIAHATPANRIHWNSRISKERSNANIATRLMANTAMIGMKTFHCQRIPVAHRTNWGRFMSVITPKSRLGRKTLLLSAGPATGKLDPHA